MSLQDGGIQEAAVLRTRAIDNAQQEETRSSDESLQKTRRLHRTKRHEQRLTTTFSQLVFKLFTSYCSNTVPR